jgi:hypothetical protein
VSGVGWHSGEHAALTKTRVHLNGRQPFEPRRNGDQGFGMST